VPVPCEVTTADLNPLTPRDANDADLTEASDDEVILGSLQTNDLGVDGNDSGDVESEATPESAHNSNNTDNMGSSNKSGINNSSTQTDNRNEVPKVLDESNLQQLIEDTARIMIQNELKVQTKRKLEAMMDTVAKLEQRVAAQDKIIKDLKCQLGDVRTAVSAVSKPVTPGPQQSPSNGSASSTSVDKPGDGTANVLSSSAVHHTYNVSTKNYYSALSDSMSVRDGACSDSSVSNVEHNKRSQLQPARTASTETKHSNLKNSTSPREQMLAKRVNSSTTHLLLGDSVLRSIDGEVMFQRPIKYQNLSVSGLTVADLLVWLKQAPVSPNVLAVVVHVGVNTCKSTDITESVWRDLLHSVGRCFPRAFLIASSIVPPRSSGTLRTGVQAANLALWKACSEEWMLFVDNEPTFLTYNGAPRKKLYSDFIHPSPQGTELLMRSLIDMLCHADTLAYSSAAQPNHNNLASESEKGKRTDDPRVDP
jgi:hypothetical protein